MILSYEPGKVTLSVKNRTVHFTFSVHFDEAYYEGKGSFAEKSKIILLLHWKYMLKMQV